jgi:branched-chain amino acid transport system substrate-binding protein
VFGNTPHRRARKTSREKVSGIAGEMPAGRLRGRTGMAWTVGGRRSATVVGAVGLVVLAACGSAASGSASQPASSCATPGVTGTEIHFGLLSPTSGASADEFDGFRSGVDARFGIANAAGGVDGRKVTYSWADDQSEPTVNAAVARTLVENDHSFGLLEATPAASGSTAYLSRSGVPVVGLAADSSWAGNANMVPFANEGSAKAAASTIGEFVQSVGGTRAAVLSLPFRASYRQAREATRASLTAAGVDVVMDGEVSAATNFIQLGAALRGDNVDTIVASVDQDSLANIVAAARAAGVNPRVVSADGYDENLITAHGQTLAGLYLYLNVRPYELANRAQAQFASAMATYAPELNPPVSEAAMWGWVSADMALRGISSGGRCPTRDGFLRGLKSVSSYDAGGLLPRPVNLATVLNTPNVCYQIVQVKPDGSGYAPLGSQPRCGRTL